MYKYVNKGGEFNIVPSVKEIPKHEVIEHTAHFTHNKFTYSDGWVYESKIYPDKIEMWSNRKLVKKDDGKYYPEK